VNTFGRRYRMTIFGASHAPAVGCVVDGAPPGIPLDIAAIQHELDRRSARGRTLATPRVEQDRVEFLGGLVDGRTTSAAIVALVRNENVDSAAYAAQLRVPRPGHSDYPAHVKYRGYHDHRGGGQFSGRMTVGIVIAGAIARQILAPQGIQFAAHTVQIGPVRMDREAGFEEVLAHREDNEVGCIDPQVADRMRAAIEAARAEQDSVGGIVECLARGLPVGVGEPFFDSVEGALAHLIFAIPATRGIEFGAGFRAAEMRGSAHNDQYAIRDGKVVTLTNNAGGVLGGLTTGMELRFRVPIKPTSSIGKPQQSVDLERLEEEELEVRGRHDPCIVPRALPVIENAAAAVMLDLMLVGGFL